VKFDLAQGTNGFVAVEVDAAGPAILQFKRISSLKGKATLRFQAERVASP
jgi:hypothetical protein